MKTRLHHITSTAITLTCFALVCMLAPSANATDYVWDGNGDVNNGGNWSDPLNWDLDSGYPSVAADTATLPYPTGTRIITVNVPITIDQIAIAEGAFNIVQLDANMEVRLVDHPSDDGHPRSEIDLNGNILTVDSGSATYFPNLDGAGTFVKVGTGQVTLNGELNFTGSFTISNGVTAYRCGDYSGRSASVLEGGTAKSHDICATLPGTITINGPGYLSRGAIEFSAGTDTFASDVTVASDAKIKFNSGITTFTGDILGSGVLTLEGPQTVTLSTSGMTYTNRLIVTNGTTVITGDFPDLKHILVDQSGTLEGLQAQFPSASVVTQNGGIWIQNANATWTGAGDGSNWTDTANWSPAIVPTNVATIPADSSPPTIIVDAPAYLDTLKMKDDTDNIIRIDNDMTIRFDDADTSGNIATLSMNNATLTVHQADSSFMQKIDGNGHLAKEGTGRVLLNGQLNFTGGFTVRNGDLAFRCGDYSATSMTVVNGGTARSHDVCATMPGTITINGDGYLGRGAIEFAAGTDIFAADVTVASDATIKILSGTTTFTGDILGSGILTIEASGGSTLDLDGLYNFAISSANANSMIADGGFVDIVDSTLSVSGEEAAGGTGIREFIIIDYSGGGTVSGRFGATNDLKVNWTIDYDGTEDNPGAVVLVQLPTTGSVLEFE